MLQDVYRYGIKHNIIQETNTEMEQIAGYICIYDDGKFECIEKGNSGKIPCPDIGTEKHGLGAANAIVERAERMRQEIRKVKELTSKPFGINIFYSGQNQIYSFNLC